MAAIARRHTSSRRDDSYRLRRLGYAVRTTRDPLAERLERTGARLVSLNRLRPNEGHRYTACPRCGLDAALWIEPDRTWMTTCACAAAGGDELDLELFLRGVA
jgi:hypothetical protein